ncbi:Hypothetical predicted protein [Paramuricea clavata]|uniref:Uncharacterized protein n=1 Tax=Paramuricea clavata TaxID=317549 RepID=A0A6S7GF18_PARCT|nr:Hypothetical predicted protein [Paramuricea clavata]
MIRISFGNGNETSIGKNELYPKLIEINVPKPSNRSFNRVQQQQQQKQQQQQQQQQASQNQTNQPKKSTRSKLPMHDQDFFWKRKRDLNWQNYLTFVRATMRHRSRTGIASCWDDRTFRGIEVSTFKYTIPTKHSHFLQLKELVRTNRIDVFTTSETWLNTTVTNKKLEIDGYKLHRLDRLYKKGGGVCAYVRKNIKSSVIKELTQISDTSFHQLWINLQYKKTKFLLACVCYRPPDCPLDCFENSLKPQENTAIAASQLLQDYNIYPDTPPTTAFNRNYTVYESEMFNFNPVSCSEVKNITSMPTNKAPGKDKVSMRIIKDCLPVILGPLTDFINASLTSSEFPQS